VFERKQLDRIVDAQRRSYRLLLWLNKAVAKGLLTSDIVLHAGRTPAKKITRWLEGHYDNLPTDGRPAGRDPDDLAIFANLLAAYFETSFEWSLEAPPRLRSECGCWCPLCTYVVAGSHLKTRKLTSGDKRRARRLKENALRQLALEAGRNLTDRDASSMCEEEAMREDIALLAYGRELLRRAQGINEGPAVLALWREFAWTRTGSPKKGFTLEPLDIVQAERRLLDRICRASQ
jgi:hypothetical protein